jgi:predicted nucleic acid-binding protein
MQERVPRVYTDTSVFGGVFDDEFQEVSRAFFALGRSQALRVVTSALIATEIERAPAQVREFFTEMMRYAEIVDVSPDAETLAQSYLASGILPARSASDALHVALATVARCTMIVSWNFRDIVNYDKIRRFNEVNMANAYPPIAIYSPSEVTGDEGKGI